MGFEISRRWTFVGSIVGLFVLLLIMVYSGEGRIGSLEELESLEVNEKVVLIGEIESERKFGDGVLLVLVLEEGDKESGEDEKIEVLCSSCGYGNVGKRAEIFGLVREIYGVKKVEALKVVLK